MTNAQNLTFKFALATSNCNTIVCFNESLMYLSSALSFGIKAVTVGEASCDCTNKSKSKAFSAVLKACLMILCRLITCSNPSFSINAL